MEELTKLVSKLLEETFQGLSFRTEWFLERMKSISQESFENFLKCLALSEFERSA